MKRTAIDMHHHSLEAARVMFNTLLNTVRLAGTSEEVYFITGKGQIRELFITYCRVYDLECWVLDPGSLTVFFE